MSRIFVHGCGVVSPAGWGIEPFRDALEKGMPLPSKPLVRPGWETPLPVRQVSPPSPRPAFMAHARLRRSSPISQHVVAAALEALGADASLVTSGNFRLGIILCVMSGCVNYSRRFYDEVLRDPSMASPLVFPETVFNAPASHIASLLGTPAMNYTLVGDPGTFLGGIAVATQWLQKNQVDACVVMGGEEADWLTSDAFHLFSHRIILGDGAGAIYLKTQSEGAMAELRCVTDSHVYVKDQTRAKAAAVLHIRQLAQPRQAKRQPGIDQRQVQPVGGAHAMLLFQEGQEHVGQPDIDHVEEKLAAQAAHETVIKPARARGGEILLRRHRRIGVIDADLRCVAMMDAVVVMLPAAEGMQRRQEGRRADGAVEPAQARKAAMYGVMADDGEIGDEDPGQYGQRDLDRKAGRQHGPEDAGGIDAKAHRENQKRQGQPPLGDGRGRALGGRVEFAMG